MKTYEWAIIGSGIAGVSTAEILIRQGHSVVLIEKNETLASETTRGFHEWLHTGSLYTLIPDRLTTLRFILGAVDDLIEFYSCFSRMNLDPTDSGLKIRKNTPGWFDENHIYFKYRVRNRKITFPWLIGIARSIHLIEKIHQHDWLRRRAGELAPLTKGRLKRMSVLIKELLTYSEVFKTVCTPDITINSRILLNDLIETAINNGLDISRSNEISSIENQRNFKILKGSSENFKAKNIAICSGDGIKNFTDVQTNTSYAPIAVVSGVPEDEKSFVELDYFPKNCINLLTKENGFGLAGGISLSNKNQCDEYLDYVLKEHKKINKSIIEESRYVGLKTEITFKNQPRGYLYHIVNLEKGLWVLIPGKFTLAFSMAPEFYRRVYKKNPKKFIKDENKNNNLNKIISNTVWKDTYNKLKEIKNGDD